MAKVADDAGYLAKLQDYYARWRVLPAYGPLQAVLGLASRSAVAVVDGAFALRRVGRDAGGRRVLQSAHPEHPDWVLGDGQELAIWGVARWVIHRLWPGRDRSP